MVRKCAWRLCFAVVVLLLAGCSRTTGSGSPETSEIPATDNKETSAAELPTIRIEPATTETADTQATETEAGTEPGADEWEMTAVIATDIHYLAGELTDGGRYFQYMVEHGDGKVVTYIEPITDALLAEVVRRKPEVLILSGDLTLDGEKRAIRSWPESLRSWRRLVSRCW